jgi:hypothetical protein
MKYNPLLIVALNLLCTCPWAHADETPGPQDQNAPPGSMTALFPGAGEISAGLPGRWRTHFEPAKEGLPEGTLGMTLALVIPSNAGDVVDQWIRANEESVARYKKATPVDGDAERIEKVIKNNEDSIKELREQRAGRDSWGRFVQIEMNEPKKAFTVTVWYSEELPPLEPGELRASLVDGGNRKIALGEQAFEILSLGERSAYGITVMTYVKSGKVRSFAHHAYVDVGRYRIEVDGYFKKRGALDQDVRTLLAMTASRVMGIERFRIEKPDGKPLVAHPKNACELILVAQGFDGKPLSQAPLTLTSGESDFPFIEGEIEGADADGNLSGETDENGRLPFRYIPPRVDIERYPFLTERPHQKREEVSGYFGVTVPDGAGSAQVALAWPHPKITRFSGVNGIDSGLWTKPSQPGRVHVVDLDSTTFTYEVSGVGEFRLKEANSSILIGSAEWPGASEFEFLYRPPQMGLDVTNLPDLQAKLLEANFKFALSYVDKLLKIPGMDKIVSKEGLTAVEVSKQAIDSLKAAHSTYELSGKAGADTAPLDRRTVGGHLKDTTALLNDMVGLVDSFVGDGGFNPGVEAGKLVLANLNALHDVHQQNWKVATSYEDLVMMPMRLAVTDSEGHTTVLMRQFGIKLNRELK